MKLRADPCLDEIEPFRRTTFKRRAIVLLSASSAVIGVNLAGCGGGGCTFCVSEAAIGLSIPIPFQSTNSTLTYGAASAPATFGTGSGLALDAASPVPADAGATVTIETSPNGKLGSLTINVPTSGGTVHQMFLFDHLPSYSAPIDVVQLATTAQQIQSAGANATAYAFQGLGSGLSYSSYGAWLVSGGGGNFATGALAFGAETTPAQIAVLNGAATFNGATFGIGATGTTPFAFTGTAQVVATFPAGAVGATFSNLTAQNVSGVGGAIALPTISGAGTIGAGVNPNQYAFALAGVGGFAGNVTGTFYGPTAQETAGVWQAANGAAPLTKLIGSFGAHR